MTFIPAVRPKGHRVLVRSGMTPAEVAAYLLDKSLEDVERIAGPNIDKEETHMTFVGPYYYTSDTFMITDPLRPGVAYEAALACARKHDGGDKRDQNDTTPRAIVDRLYDIDRSIIGYVVRARHYVGTGNDAHADKQKDNPHGARLNPNAES